MPIANRQVHSKSWLYQRCLINSCSPVRNLGETCRIECWLLHLIGAVDGVDLDEFAVVGDQVVARFDLSGGDEVVLRRDVERVLDRRLDRSAPNDQLHHHRRPNKLLLNPLQLQRTSRIKLAASKHQMADFDILNR
jgi:hypothetical protein